MGLNQQGSVISPHWEVQECWLQRHLGSPSQTTHGLSPSDLHSSFRLFLASHGGFLIKCAGPRVPQEAADTLELTVLLLLTSFAPLLSLLTSFQRWGLLRKISIPV